VGGIAVAHPRRYLPVKNLLRHSLASLVIIGSLSGVLAIAHPSPASAACGKLLTFPAWYDGLVKDKSSCELKEIGQGTGKVTVERFVVRVILNITEMILQLVAYATVVFLIVGGFKYITSTGDSTNMANAKKTILNSIIGLIIALLSVGIVNAVAGSFG
jgi:hypothetical protein